MVAIIIMGAFISVLNQTVMSPALPSIMRDLGITAADGQWLTSIFLLVNGLMIPVTAYLIGRFTTRQLFFAAMLIFLAGTAICAFSSGFLMLLGGRVLQAVGAGIQLPFVSVMVMVIFPKERRGFALGIVGIVMGFAPAVGPTVAGWLVDQWGWHYIFWGIAPLAVLVILFALFLLKNIGTREAGKLDWLSVLLSTLAFGGMLFGFSSAGSAGWDSPRTYVSILAGALVLVFFVRRQLRHRPPLLDLRALGRKTFSTATILTMIVSAGLTSGAVLTPIFLQNVHGFSAMHSGIIMVPAAVAMACMSPVSGKLFDRFGPRILSITGLSVMTIGTTMLALLRKDTPEFYICFAYTFRMVGISFVNMPLSTWGINALPNSLIAHGNAINNTARQLAGSIGTALLVTIMTIVSQNAALPEIDATVRGVNAAFGGAVLFTATALILAIIKVRGGKTSA